MACAARDKELIAGAEAGGNSIDRPPGEAINSQDCLITLLVKMSYMLDRELHGGRNRHFVSVEKTVGLVAALDKGDGHAANVNDMCDEEPVFRRNLGPKDRTRP